MVCRLNDAALMEGMFKKITALFDQLADATKEQSRPVFLSILLLTVQEMFPDDGKKLECF